MKGIDAIVDSYRLESGRELIVQVEDEETLILDLWTSSNGRLVSTVRIDLEQCLVEVRGGSVE